MRARDIFNRVINKEQVIDDEIKRLQLEKAVLPTVAQLLDELAGYQYSRDSSKMHKMYTRVTDRLTDYQKLVKELEDDKETDTTEYHECVRMIAVLTMFIDYFNECKVGL